MPEFVFITCQVGAEAAVKQEIARECSALRFAFSRPGFLTFKRPAGLKLADDFGQELVFARAAGFCLGKVPGNTVAERIESVVRSISELPVTRLHVWPRDRYSPGYRDYEPGMTPDVIETERLIRGRAQETGAASLETVDSAPPISNLQFSIFNLQSSPGPTKPSQRSTTAEPKQPLVFDAILIEREEWWIGFHRVHSPASAWPGGFLQAELPPQAVSRAWLKMQEALIWSGFPIQLGERCVEIGSAPGGASQFLLGQGLDVIGIDPAEMDAVVLADPHFRHVRKRSKDVPRREFVGVDWLTCDVNLPPNYTLDTVQAIVSHPGVRLEGMLLTLKLVEWELAAEVPKYLERIRSWGFRNIRARQLHHNRQEICVAASRRSY